MKRSQEKEMMDLPGNPADLLEGDLSNLRLLNRVLGGYRAILWGLKRVVDERRLCVSPFSTLERAAVTSLRR